MKLSAVMPLKTTGRHYADNIPRCDILFSSLRHFSTPDIFDRFLIVVPHDEVEAAKKYSQAWSDFPIEIIDEAEHFAVFQKYNQRHQIRNWHRQQIIKLYGSELINTEYFLVFDPDTFATHPFTIDTLLPGGKALTHMQSREIEKVFWSNSAELLEQDPHLEKDGIWLTPVTMSATLCRALHKRLEDKFGIPWMEVLLQRYAMDWTEYTLYWLNAEHQGLIDQYHAFPEPGGVELHTSVSIWRAGTGGENLQKWDAAKHFSPDDKGIFAVIQSNTGLNIDQITKKLSPYMPIKRQAYDRQFDLKLKIAETYSAIVRLVMKKAGGILGGR